MLRKLWESLQVIYMGWSWRFGPGGTPASRPMKDSTINWARFVNLGQRLVGKPYVFAAETNLADPDPDHIKELDCSELVEWLYAQIGLAMPDGSYNQFKVTVPITGAPRVGDLGFKWIPETKSVHHVGVFLGDQVLEAKGKSWGTILTERTVYEASSQFAGWRRHKDIKDA